jgi:hypothetical protein
MRNSRIIVLAGVLVIVLSGSALAQSVWTKCNSPTAGALRSVAWTGNQFVIGLAVTVGNPDTHKILTSPDGNVWTNRNIDSSENTSIFSITSGGGVIVAVGAGILTSLDGITWTKRFVDSTNTTGLHSVTWTGNQFVAVGTTEGLRVDTVLVVASNDGISWKRRPIEKLGGLYTVTWTGSQLVAMGSTSPASRNGDTNFAATSPDGQTWTYTVIPRPIFAIGEQATQGGAEFIAYTGSQLVAVGWVTEPVGIQPPFMFYSSYYILTSPDGQVWSQNQSVWDTLYNRLNSVIWTGSQLVAAGEYGTIITSPDYTNWTKAGSGTIKNLWSIAKSDNLLVAVGDSGTILTSPISSTAIISAPSQTTRKGLEVARNTVSYTLNQESLVSIKLFNLHGQLIETLCDRTQPAGPHTATIPSGPANGNYILSFSNGLTRINKNILIAR